MSTFFWGLVEKRCSLLRVQFTNLLKDTPNREAEFPTVVTRQIRTRGIDVDSVHTVRIAVSRRPEEAAGTLSERRAIFEVPRMRRRERGA